MSGRAVGRGVGLVLIVTACSTAPVSAVDAGADTTVVVDVPSDGPTSTRDGAVMDVPVRTDTLALISVLFDTTQSTPLLGAGTGTATMEDCPPAECVGGFELQPPAPTDLGGIVHLATRCVAPLLAPDGVLTQPGDRLPDTGSHGTGSNTGAALTALCRDGSVLAGLTAWTTPAGVRALAPRCSPLGRLGRSVAIGSPVTSTTAGDTVGGMAATVDCPMGSVAIGVAWRAGVDVQALGLRCGSPSPTP